MKCPTIDELSEYVEDGQGNNGITRHVETCAECQHVVEAFEGERHFIKDTLQSPTLPDDFSSLVLDQLAPYEQKRPRRNRASWKRITLSVAGLFLAFGIGATLNPSFADWIGGMFSPEESDSTGAIVDDGLRMATEDGLAERVNLQVANSGLTFKVEDVVVDSSRVALSYQILDGNGKPQDTHVNWTDLGNRISVVGQDDIILDRIGTGWQDGSDYGLAEIRIPSEVASDTITIRFDLVEMNGVKGSWQLEVPVDLTKNRELTNAIPLQHASANQHGVAVRMKEIQFAPSLTELQYETSFTEEEQVRVTKEIQQLEAQFGGESIDSDEYGTAIEYHIENEDNQTIYEHNYGLHFTKARQLGDLMSKESSSVEGDKLGEVLWNQTFIPQEGDGQLTLVLDGVYKTVPSDFSVSFKPNDLKRNPVSFEYEGNFMTINKAKKQGEYSFQKSLMPIDRETIFMIEMEGGMEANASRLGTWVLTDGKGNAYPIYEGGGSILKQEDANGRYKAAMNLKVYDLDEIPEELTLHLVSVTRYEEVKEKWEVPLH